MGRALPGKALDQQPVGLRQIRHLALERQPCSGMGGKMGHEGWRNMASIRAESCVEVANLVPMKVAIFGFLPRWSETTTVISARFSNRTTLPPIRKLSPVDGWRRTPLRCGPEYLALAAHPHVDKVGVLNRADVHPDLCGRPGIAKLPEATPRWISRCQRS